MNAYDIIKKKRDGEELSSEEIKFFIDGAVNGDIQDYQVSAFLMAVYFKGMSPDETASLTFAIRDSGEKLSLDGINGIRVDKHSTGGVGDKTSLTVAPIVATLGLKVAKMSGRGLGHTGGTIDKLEAIPNFNTALSKEDFNRIVNDIGISIIGQTARLAPADKKLYALRDVTATVDSLPLIVSSIMGKKLCMDDDCIVLDVKTGSGAFMKTLEDSRALATAMVDIGKKAGKKTMAIITDMDAPLGCAIGNSLEVIEAIDALKGKAPKDYTELCYALSANILQLAGYGNYDFCLAEVMRVIKDGSALETFKKMVIAQGGDVSVVDNPKNFKQAKYFHKVISKKEGYIYSVNAEDYGKVALTLGAGRRKVGDSIDFSAGIMLKAKRGDFVKAGDILAELYTDNKDAIATAEELFLNATEISDSKPIVRNVVIEKIL